jgi:cytidylate kinase
MSGPIITIDGPAGAGKSTIARRVAERLGLRYLDTGAMYRAVTWKAIREGIEDPLLIAKMIPGTRIEVGERVVVDGTDVTTEIRTPELTRRVRPVAATPECRVELVRLQREIGREGGLVSEGRDQGSVVFPGAEFRFYLDASVEERARRRQAESGGDLETILRDIEARDESDRTRPVGPLVKPEGAIVLDSTPMSIDEVVERICSLVNR